MPERNFTAWFFVIGILGAEVAGWLFVYSDVLRAVMVACVLVPCCLFLAVGSRFSVPVVPLRKHAPILWGGLIYIAIGAYGVLLGWMNRNGAYYILADVYHWYGEGLCVAVVTVAILHGMSSRHLMLLVCSAALLMGVLAMFVAVAGTFGLKLAGGHVIPNLQVWRLEAGRGFPTIPLIMVTAVLTKGGPRGWGKLVAWLAILILLATLVVTFKRSQWLCYVFLLVAFLAPWRWQQVVQVSAVVFSAVVGVAILSLPGGIDEAKHEALKAITYNPSYDTEEALDSRAMQWSAVFPYIVRRPLGHGFGAKIYVFTPSKDDAAATHYVHNAYLYFGVQVGIPGTLLTLLLMAVLAVSLWAHFGVNSEWDWMVHASFACLCALAIMSLVLVCFHTPLFGFTVGLAALSLEHIQSPGRSDRGRHAPRDGFPLAREAHVGRRVAP